ncbi:MAG: hypothetical protein P8I91_05330 [Phycisphaerales bacterium]|nr:hypothetical protein [Phycisphaerales bacterium]
MKYKVKGLHGDHPEVVFRCDACHETLSASLLEAGTDTNCPGCAAVLNVPATRERAEWKRDMASRLREAATRQDAKDAAKQQAIMLRDKKDAEARAQRQSRAEARIQTRPAESIRAYATKGVMIRRATPWVVSGLSVLLAVLLLDIADKVNLAEWPAGLAARVVVYVLAGTTLLIGIIWLAMVVAAAVCELLPFIASNGIRSHDD